MSIDAATANDEHELLGAGELTQRRRRPKRPSITAMIKAAKAAGLEIASIECDDGGVKLVCGGLTSRVDVDESELDRRMTEQMGVTRLGGRKRR